jgi:hypothetical protein
MPAPTDLFSAFADIVHQRHSARAFQQRPVPAGIGPELKMLFGLSFGYEMADEPANAIRIPRADLAATSRFIE